MSKIGFVKYVISMKTKVKACLRFFALHMLIDGHDRILDIALPSAIRLYAAFEKNRFVRLIENVRENFDSGFCSIIPL